MHIGHLARPGMIVVAILGALATMLGEAHAQRASGIQMTPDSRGYLINKDVGEEHWVISFDLEHRTVTGNVFKADGSRPSFIWCEIKSETAAPNPADNEYILDCFGSDACAAAPCSDQAWTLIASGIPVRGSFLLPDQTHSTFRGHVQPIFTEHCAIPSCHSGVEPSQGLNLEAAQSYKNIFLRLATQDEHFLIAPFDLSESHVYHKITGMQEEGQGDRMPPSDRPALSEDQIQAIEDWILEGAANN